MITGSKIKSLDFYRKIPRDLTEATLSGAWLSIVAALIMIFLFGMELNDYLTINTTTNVVVDRSLDGEQLRIDFNISFPALSCEFASVDVSDVLGTHRMNITKTVRKFPIRADMHLAGPEFHPGPIPVLANYGDNDGDSDDDVEGAVALNARMFEEYGHQYSLLVVNFYAPWCSWSQRLKPAWEKAAKIIRERYDPEYDKRILLAKVDCAVHIDLCRRHHIQGYPSVRIFRKGSDVRENHGHHEHESYYGDRDTESLVLAMEALVSSVTTNRQLALEDKSENNSTKRPAPKSGACRIEGFVRVKKVPGNLIISAHSGSHSFDAAAMNVSHFVSHFSFGKRLSPKMFSELTRLTPYGGKNTDRLSGQVFITTHDNVTFDHYLQLVKTEVLPSRSFKATNSLEQYDYTAHSSMLQSETVPVAKFHFELSPMQVLITENSKSFSHFLTNLCAIIGGVFTVAGIIDSMFYNAMRLVKKIELGKHM